MRKDEKLYVVKSNEIIQTLRAADSLWEQKTISYVCAIIVSQIDKTRPIIEQKFSFSIPEFIEKCGLKSSGKTSGAVEDAISKLMQKSHWINMQNEDGSEYETNLAWILKATIEKKPGSASMCYFYADPDLVPVILNLHGNYTKYECENILKMRRAGSIKLYEIFKSNQFKKKIDIEPHELMRLLNCDQFENYVKDFWNFKKNVLLPALNEINELTDLEITIEAEKPGKSFTNLHFEINNADKFLKRLKKEGLLINEREER